MKATAKIYQFPEVVADPIGSQQLRASEVIDVLTRMVEKHGNLKVDGITGIEYCPSLESEGAIFAGSKPHFFVVTGREVEFY